MSLGPFPDRKLMAPRRGKALDVPPIGSIQLELLRLRIRRQAVAESRSAEDSSPRNLQATAALEHATALRRNAQLRLLAKSLLPPQQAESIQHHVKFLMAQHTYLAKARQHMPGYVEAYEEHLQREAQLTAAVQQEISRLQDEGDRERPPAPRPPATHPAPLPHPAPPASSVAPVRLAPPRGLGPGSGLGTGPQGAGQPALKPGGLKADPASPKAQLGQLQQQGQLDHGIAHLNGAQQQQGGQQQQALQQPLLQHQQGAQRQSKVDQAFWPELAQQLHPAQQQPLTVNDPPQHPHLHQPPPQGTTAALQGAAEAALVPSHTWQQVTLPDGRMALVPVHSPADPAASSLLHPYPPASTPDLPSLAHAPSTPHPSTSTATATVPLSLTITLTHSAPDHPSTLTASPGWPGLQPMTSPPPHLQPWGPGAGPYTHPPALASWPPPPQQPMLPGLAHQSLQQQQQVRQQPGGPGGWSVYPPGPAATRLPGGGVGWGPGPPLGPSPPWRPAWAPGSPDPYTWGQPPPPPPPMSMAQQQTQAMGSIQLPGPGPGLQQLHSGWYDQGWGWPGAPPAGQEGARWQQVLATGQGQGAAAAPAWQLLGMEGPPATWAPPDWRPAASTPYVSQGLSQGQLGGGWGGWGQPASPGGDGTWPEGPYPPYPPPWLQPPSSPQPPAVLPPQPPHQAHPTPPLQSEQSAQQQAQLPGAQPAPRAPGPGFPQQPPQDTTPPAGPPSPSLPLHPLPTPLPSPPPSPPGLPAPTPAPSSPSAGPAAAAGPSPSLPKGHASAQPGAAVDPASGSSGAEGHAQAGASPQAQVAASSSNGRQGEVPSKQGRGKPGSPRGGRHTQGDGPGTGGTGNGGGGGGGGGGLWGALSVVQEAAEVKSSSSSSSNGSAASCSAASQPAVLAALGSTPSLPSRVPSSRSSSEHSSDQRQRVSSRHSGGSHSPSSTSTLGGAGPPWPRPASPAALLRPSLPGLQLLPGEALGRGSQAEPPSPWQHVGRLGLRGGPQEEDAISIGSTVKRLGPPAAHGPPTAHHPQLGHTSLDSPANGHSPRLAAHPAPPQPSTPSLFHPTQSLTHPPSFMSGPTATNHHPWANQGASAGAGHATPAAGGPLAKTAGPDSVHHAHVEQASSAVAWSSARGSGPLAAPTPALGSAPLPNPLKAGHSTFSEIRPALQPSHPPDHHQLPSTPHTHPPSPSPTNDPGHAAAPAMLPGRLGGRVRAADVVAAGLAAVRSSAAPAGLPPQHGVLERSLPSPFPSDSPRASMAVTWAGGLFTVQKGDSSHDSGDWSHPGGSLEAQAHIGHHPVLLAQGDPRGAARVRYLTRDDSIPSPEPAAAPASASTTTTPAHASDSTSFTTCPTGASVAGSGTSTSATTASALSIPPPSALTPGMTSASAPPSTLNNPHTPLPQPPSPAASEATTMPDSQHRPGAAAASGPSQLDTVRGQGPGPDELGLHPTQPGPEADGQVPGRRGSEEGHRQQQGMAHLEESGQGSAGWPASQPDDDEVAHELDAAAVQLERAMAAAAAAQAKRGAARPKPALLGSLLVGLEEGLDGGRPGAAATDLMSSRSGPQAPLLRISSSSLAVSSSQPSGPSRTTITGSTSQLTVHHPGLGPRFTSSGSGNGSAAHLDSGLISQDTTRQPSNTHPRSHSGSGLLAPAAAMATRPSSNNSMLAPPASQQQQGAMGGASSSFAPKQATKGLHWGNQSLQPKAAAASTSNSGSASLGKQLSHQPGLLAGSGSKVSGGSLTRGASASQAAAASVSRQSSGLAPAQSTAGSKAGVGRIIHQVLNTDNDFGDSSDDSDFSAHPLPHHRDNRMTGDSGESSEHDFGGDRPHGGQGGVSGSRHGSGGDGRGNLQSGMPARRMAMSGSLLSGSFDTDF